jgi:8-oxo-dGTP pyrophosphatase MutT (NUDIX family)
MAFGTLAKALSLNIEIEKPECVNKSWPEFWTELASWAGELRRVSAIIVQDKEKYLIVKKPRKDHAWQFPQGGVEEGETLLEGAERELKEECGEDLCAAFFQEPVGEYAYFFPADFVRHCDGKKPKHRGARVTFFRAEFIEGDIELEPAELEDYKWVTREELGDWFEGEYLEEVERFL